MCSYSYQQRSDQTRSMGIQHHAFVSCEFHAIPSAGSGTADSCWKVDLLHQIVHLASCILRKTGVVSALLRRAVFDRIVEIGRKRLF